MKQPFWHATVFLTWITPEAFIYEEQHRSDVMVLKHLQSLALLSRGWALQKVPHMGTHLPSQSSAHHTLHSLGTLCGFRRSSAGAAQHSQGISSVRLLSASAVSTSALHAASPSSKETYMSSSRKSTGGSKEQSLQQIAGIGPRNEQRFISAGIDTVPRLAGIFFESNKGDEDRMRVYLQVPSASLGSTSYHKHHQ